MEEIEYTKKLRCCANCKFGESEYEPKLREGTYTEDFGTSIKKGESFRYWNWYSTICRFNPPTPYYDGNGDYTMLVPCTNGQDWCWQFKNKHEES